MGSRLVEISLHGATYPRKGRGGEEGGILRRFVLWGDVMRRVYLGGWEGDFLEGRVCWYDSSFVAAVCGVMAKGVVGELPNLVSGRSLLEYRTRVLILSIRKGIRLRYL